MDRKSIIILSLFLGAIAFIAGYNRSHDLSVASETNNVNPVSYVQPTHTPTPEPILFPIVSDKEMVQEESDDIAEVRGVGILHEVPFTPQAPFGNWDDPRQDNGCEEASVIMAMHWVSGEALTFIEAEKEIIALSDFEKDQYGYFLDTSAEDTMKFMASYFDYQDAVLKEDIDAEDIKTELLSGNIVIVPVNGQKLNNPYYTPPGPIQHMVVVIGYDDDTKEFITNDPGTKRGRHLRYPEKVFGEALQNYITGFHEPIPKVNKVMIVIRTPSSV